MPIILELGKLRQESHKFQVSLGYIAIPHLTSKQTESITEGIYILYSIFYQFNFVILQLNGTE